jgi:hypothetical protein
MLATVVSPSGRPGAPGQVALVQVAHGGHKGGAAAGQGGAQFGNGVGDEHGMGNGFGS